MKKMLLILSLLALGGWSIPEAHDQANKTLVEFGDFCSGTIIDKERGLVATANHCAEILKVVEYTEHVSRDRQDDTYVTVETHYREGNVTRRFLDDEGNVLGFITYAVEVLAVDTVHDAAILRNKTSLSFPEEATLSDTPVRFGDVIFTITNPLLLPGAVTQGYVAQPKVIFPTLGPDPLILFEAGIDHGSSGGGLFNSAGEMIGLTNWKNPNGYESIALPIKWVSKLLAGLK